LDQLCLNCVAKFFRTSEDSLVLSDSPGSLLRTVEQCSITL